MRELVRYGLGGLLLLILLSAAQDVLASSQTQKQQVLSCVSDLKSDADWVRCNRMIQQPCAGEKYGSTEHLTCLEALHSSWSEYLDAARESTIPILVRDGQEGLGEFAASWSGMAKNRCTALAEYQQEVSPGIARIQCELSEIVGFSAELAACRNGLSDAPFCIRRGAQ